MLSLAEGRDRVPFVDLDGSFYKLVGQFDERFPSGPPSMVDATSLTVRGDWTFGADVTVRGGGAVRAEGAPGRLEPGTVIGEG